MSLHIPATILICFRSTKYYFDLHCLGCKTTAICLVLGTTYLHFHVNSHSFYNKTSNNEYYAQSTCSNCYLICTLSLVYIFSSCIVYNIVIARNISIELNNIIIENQFLRINNGFDTRLLHLNFD